MTRHQIANPGVRIGRAVVPERDRVAVQRAQGPRGDADVEPATLSSGQDLGRNGVTGSEAGAERWLLAGYVWSRAIVRIRGVVQALLLLDDPAMTNEAVVVNLGSRVPCG